MMAVFRTRLGLGKPDGRELVEFTDERVSENAQLTDDELLRLSENLIKLNAALLTGTPAEQTLVAAVMAEVNKAVQVSDDRVYDLISDPLSDSGAVVAAKQDRDDFTINIMAPKYGLAGNGTTNDAAKLQAVIDAAPVGSVLVCPPNVTVRLTAPVTVNKAVTLRGGSYLANPTGSTFIIGASNVILDGLKITGPTGAPLIDQKFVTTTGTQAAPLTGVKIVNCTMTGSQYSCLWLHWLKDFVVAHNRITNFQYSGITLLSPKEGLVAFNTVRFAIMASPLVNAYGIAVTDDVNTIAGRAENIRIIGNFITDILKWEAIDTHGGKGIHVLGNTMVNVRQGVSLMTGNATRLVPPEMCVVANNYTDRGIADDTAFGLCLAGRGTTMLASATIVNNTMIGFGQDISLGAYDPALTSVVGNTSTTTGMGRKLPSESPYRQFSARPTIALNNTNAQTVTISLPAGMFTQPPAVWITKDSGSGAAYNPYVSSKSTTQVVVGIYSPTPAATGTVALNVKMEQASPLDAYGLNQP